MQSNKSDGGQRGRKAAGRDRSFVADGFMKAVSFRCNSHFRGSSKSSERAEHYAAFSGTNATRLHFLQKYK